MLQLIKGRLDARPGRRGTAFLALLLLAPAALACVVPRDLDRQIELAGDEVVYGTILDFEEVWANDIEGEKFLATKVRFHADECLVAGDRNVEVEIYFRGGVLPGSPTTTITPSPEDIQVGKRLLLFLAKRDYSQQAFGKDPFILDTYAECFSLDHVQSRSVDRQMVVGKGYGFAFENNVDLSQACARIKSSVQKFRLKQAQENR